MKNITDWSIKSSPSQHFWVKMHFIKFAALALCLSFSKRTNILYKIYFLKLKL